MAVQMQTVEDEEFGGRCSDLAILYELKKCPIRSVGNLESPQPPDKTDIFHAFPRLEVF